MLKNPLFIIALAACSFAAEIQPQLLGYTLGGAGDLLQMGNPTDKLYLGMTLGQSPAGNKTWATDPNAPTEPTIDILPGFWITIGSVTEASPILQPQPRTLSNSFVRTTLEQNVATLHFSLSFPQSASVHILDLQGRNIAPTWDGSLGSGISRVPISLESIAQSKIFIIVHLPETHKSFSFPITLTQESNRN